MCIALALGVPPVAPFDSEGGEGVLFYSRS